MIDSRILLPDGRLRIVFVRWQDDERRCLDFDWLSRCEGCVDIYIYMPWPLDLLPSPAGRWLGTFEGRAASTIEVNTLDDPDADTR